MKPGIPAEEELRVKSLMEGKGFQIHESRGANFTLFGVVGDTAAFDMNQLRVYDCIDKGLCVCRNLTSVLTGCFTRKTVS